MNVRRLLVAAIPAGLLGAVTIDVYLWVTTVVPTHGSMLPTWEFIASTVIGKIAFTNSSYAWLGLFMHVCVSIGWAGGYTYMALTQPFINRRWPISGLVYGVVVYFLMQVVLLVDNNFRYPDSLTLFFNALIAHTIFFGLPVAYVVHAITSKETA